jgi:hypothetical protein
MILEHGENIFLDISSTRIDALSPSLRMRRNPPPKLMHFPHLYECVETCSIEVFCMLSQPLPDLAGHHLSLSNILERIFDSVVNRITRQILSTVNRKHFFVNILCIESFCPQKRPTERYLSLAQSSSTVAILTTEPSLCYLDCHEAGLCCYVLIHIENLLHPLQLFCFHLCDSS